MGRKRRGWGAASQEIFRPSRDEVKDIDSRRSSQDELNTKKRGPHKPRGNRPERDSFGYRLMQRRLALKVTQAQVANAIGLSKSAISQFEADSTYPSYDALVALRKALGFDLHYLITGEGPRKFREVLEVLDESDAKSNAKIEEK